MIFSEGAGQTGGVEKNPSTLLDEAKFPEFIDKESDTRPGCPEHSGQDLM
jgi:hypothetical protein